MTTFATVIELERHIEILLLGHDCVIVPDFGGFTAHHVDARYDGRDSMFLPPIRTIGFNPQLTMNDSLLAQSYVEAYDISYPEAIHRIADEVTEMRQVLAETGSYELNGIGILSINEDGNYNFDPCEAGILTPELYGLGSFGIRPLASADAAEESAENGTSPLFAEKEAVKVVPLKEENHRTVAASPALVEEEGSKEKSAEFIQIRKSFLRNLVAACIALVAFFSLSTPLGTPGLQKSQIDTNLLTRIMPKEITSMKNTHSLMLNQEGQAEPAAAKETLREDEETQGDTSYYSIVLASRVTKHNAANYAERLQNKGFKAARVLITASNVKVIYGKYSTEAQAYSELNRLHADEAFADGWVTKVNE